MILACHQPNFAPWLPWFQKMNLADIFVLMINCQFEKNGYQNRAEVFGKWWTKPVTGGKCEIKDKHYADGQKLYDVNIHWIMAIAKTLNINTSKIHVDFPTEKRGTERIIELCKRFGCDQYLTNPDAMDKYLDEKLMNDSGIEVVPFNFPHKKHVFEAFDEWGIEGTIKMMEKEKNKCAI